MEIDPNSWHYRAYLAWKERRKRWMSWPDPPEQLDLCRYCRVVFLFGPWRWFIQGYRRKPWMEVFRPWVITVIVVAVSTFIWLLAHYTGQTLTYTAIVVGVVVGGAGALIFLAYFIGEWRIPQRATRATVDVSATGVQKVGKSLVWSYLKAKKRKICPILTVQPKEKEEA